MTLGEGVNPPRKQHIYKGSQIPRGYEDGTLSQTGAKMNFQDGRSRGTESGQHADLTPDLTPYTGYSCRPPSRYKAGQGEDGGPESPNLTAPCPLDHHPQALVRVPRTVHPGTGQFQHMGVSIAALQLESLMSYLVTRQGTGGQWRDRDRVRVFRQGRK